MAGVAQAQSPSPDPSPLGAPEPDAAPTQTTAQPRAAAVTPPAPVVSQSTTAGEQDMPSAGASATSSPPIAQDAPSRAEPVRTDRSQHARRARHAEHARQAQRLRDDGATALRGATKTINSLAFTVPPRQRVATGGDDDASLRALAGGALLGLAAAGALTLSRAKRSLPA
jgi:hypothetical protein